MKIFFLLSLFSFCSYAVELSKEQSDPRSNSIQKFILKTEVNGVYEKRSNRFDQKPDLRLGNFTVQGKQLSSIKKELEEISKEIKSADNYLKTKKSSFNELSKSQSHHGDYFLLDKFKILPDSQYYQKLEKNFKALQNMGLLQVSGIKLDSSLKELTQISNGKDAGKSKFDLRFSCEKAELPTICFIKDQGFLFLQ